MTDLSRVPHFPQATLVALIAIASSRNVALHWQKLPEHTILNTESKSLRKMLQAVQWQCCPSTKQVYDAVAAGGSVTPKL